MLNPKSNGPGDFSDGLDEAESRKPLRPTHFVVLAIDDDPGMLKFFEAALADQGVRVEGTSDPLQGLEMARVLGPDLVLLDLTMPGMDGMQVLHGIKDYDPSIRVVMVTGKARLQGPSQIRQVCSNGPMEAQFSWTKLEIWLRLPNQSCCEC